MAQTKILVVGTPQQYKNLSQRLQSEYDFTFDYQDSKTFKSLVSISPESDAIVYYMGIETDIDQLVTQQIFQKILIPVILLKDNLTIDQTVDLMNAGAKGVVAKTDTDRLVKLINRTLAEASLPSSDSLYKDIVESQTEFICRYDAGLRILYANPAYCTWQGLSLNELVGTSFSEQISPEDRDQAIDHVRSLTSEHPVATSIHNTVFPDGSLHKIEWKDQAVFDADGNIIEYQGVGRDVTVRERQARELENYRVHMDAVLATMQDALMTISLPERETIFVSQAFESVFGYPHKNFMDDPKFFMQVVHPDDLETAIEAQQTCLREGFVQFDHRIIWPNGQVRWLHRRAWINYDENGQPVRVNDSARDITDRINAERSLATSEELHRVILNTISDAVFITDDEGRFTFIYPNTQIIFGYSHDEVVSMKTIQKLTGRVAFDLSQLKQDTEISNIEHRIIDKWGISHDLLINVKDISIGDGTILYSCRDVTEHKQAQNKFEVMFRTNPAIVGLSSIETGEYVEVNEAFYEILGFDRNEVIGAKAVDIAKLDPEWRAITIKKLQDQGYVHDEETVIIAKDGTPIPVLLSAEIIQIQGKAYNFTSAIDITDRKKTEDALIQSEQRYRQMFESVRLPKLITDPHTARILDANPAAIEFYGYPLDTLKTMTMLQINIAEPDVVMEEMQEVLAGERDLCQFEQRLGNGTIRAVEGYCSVIQYSSQDALYCTYIDVTERNRIRVVLEDVNSLLEQQVTERTQALALSKNRIEAIFNHSADGIVLLDAEMKIEQTNYAFDELFNIIQDSYLGKSLLDLVGENQQVYLAGHFPDIVKHHETRRVESEFLRMDGTTFEGEISIAPINRSDNPVENIVCVIRDVTERKQFDMERRERERLLRQLADNYPAYVSIIEEDLTIGFTAGYEFKNLGLDPEQFVGATLDRVFGDQADKVRSHYERAFEGIQQSFELKNEHYRVVPLADEDGKISKILAVVENITERRKAENAVAEERNLLRTVIDAVPDFIYVKDSEHRMMLNNTAHALSLGLIPDDMVGKTDLELFPEHMANKFHHDEKSLFETEKPIRNLLEHSLGSDGQEIWALTTKVPLRNLSGELIGLVGITHDVTELKRKEEALRKSEERLRLFIEATPIATLICNSNKEIVLTNEATESLFQYTRSELIGQSIQLLVPVDFRGQHESHMTGFIEGDYERLSKVEIFGRRKNGETFVADIQLRRIEIESETLIMVLVLDVTKRKQVEESLVKALEKEKELAELRSRFVSTASHQFRTPLAAIIASTETLRKLRDRLTEQQIDGRLDRIQSQVNRMKKLMEDVLELSRMQSDQIQYKPEMSDLSALCREIIDDFTHQAVYTDRIIFSGAKKPIFAKLDPHLMHHVLSNLIHNALKYSHNEVYVELLQVAHEIIFKVRDQGIGVSEADIKSLFIPFTRAKNVGAIEGTGLGLSIVKQAVDEHKGTIDVKSTVGEGTTFTVRIPYHSEGV